jgi:hypothetical protein
LARCGRLSIASQLYGAAPESAKGHYGPAERTWIINVLGDPDMTHVSTSKAERTNLNIRMHSRGMTRLTNASQKKMENHAHDMALRSLYYNFVRIHKTLKITPAMAPFYGFLNGIGQITMEAGRIFGTDADDRASWTASSWRIFAATLALRSLRAAIDQILLMAEPKPEGPTN